MNIRRIFLTRHSELRFGWRMVLFLAISTAFLFILLLGFAAVGLRGEILNGLVFCIALLAASTIMTRAINRKPLRSIGIGLRGGAPREFGLGLLLGFLMMAGILLVEYFSGLAEIQLAPLTFSGVAQILTVGTLSYLPAAAAEELLFRGYPFQTFMQGVTFLPATLATAALFAFAHLGNPNVTPLALLNIALAGIWLSFAYLKTRRLWLPIGLHFAWNFTQTSLCGFPTSGRLPESSSLLLLTQMGPEAVTGGAFGPEGGVLATAALLISTLHIIKSPLYHGVAGIITLDSLEDLLPEFSGNGRRE